MVDTEFHKRPVGPLALPGRYQARLSVGDWSMTQEFELLKDPRVATGDAALAEQFEFLIRMRDKLSEIAAGVNTVRALRRRLDDWSQRLAADETAADLRATIHDLRNSFDAVEAELVQAEFTSEGDTLNYRMMLFEKLSDLVPVVSSADTRPTVQSYAVYDKLAGQVDEQLARLAALIDGDLSRVNAQLAALGVDIIAAG